MFDTSWYSRRRRGEGKREKLITLNLILTNPLLRIKQDHIKDT